LLAVGGSVGDQSGDGLSGVVEVFAASDVTLQGPPLLGFGDGVFDADPLTGLLVSFLLPAGHLVGRGVLVPRRLRTLFGWLFWRWNAPDYLSTSMAILSLLP
jgi:hypothetical protein